MIKTPKKYEGDLLDDSTLAGSRQRNISISALSQMSRSPQTPPKSGAPSNVTSNPKRASSASTEATQSTPKKRKLEKQNEAPKKITLRKVQARATPPPAPLKFSRVPKNTYTGPQVEYNPNLRPAAFPTLDTPERVEAFEQHLAEQRQKQEQQLVGTVDPDVVNGPDLHADHPLNERWQNFSLQSPPPSANKATHFRRGHELAPSLTDEVSDGSVEEIRQSGPRPSQRLITPSTTEPSGASSNQSQAEVSAQQSHEEDSRSESPPRRPNALYHENFEQITEIAQMTDHEMNMAEMETSDEEEMARKDQIKKPIGTQVARWDNLSKSAKLDSVDSVHEQYPDDTANMIFQRLNLTDAQKMEMVQLLERRQGKEREEEDAQQLLQARVHEYMLKNSGRPMSQERYRQMLQETIYKEV